MQEQFVHPYMPNSVPAIKQSMLDELGVKSVEEIYQSVIPDDLLFKGRLKLPEPLLSEYELEQHVMGLLKQNVSTAEYGSFLGGGCYRHQVPAICDELNMRGEFLTAYCGDTYSDHGKMQAIFEYTSMMAELVDMDTVSYTTYDQAQSVSSSLRTALRVQKARGEDRSVFLVPSTMDPEVYSQAVSYCASVAQLVKVKAADGFGPMDLEDLEGKLKLHKTAAVFYENPSYLGLLEPQAEAIAALAHQYGALCVTKVDVASLGVIESPANLGSDIVCGDIQPLGMHQQLGGGQAGFIATRHELEYLRQYPTYMYGICKTGQKDRFGWGRAMNERCSHGSREKANEYFGTATGLWAITAGIYLASMGPQGMMDLGTTIMQNAYYLAEKLSEIPALRVLSKDHLFQEILVNFDGCGKTVKEVNAFLLENKIFGGIDLSKAFPELGQTALYCVSELTTKAEMDRLCELLAEFSRRS